MSGCHSTPSVFDVWAMLQDRPLHWSAAAKRRPLTNEIATPAPFTVETTVLPSFAHRAAACLENLGRVHRPRMTHSSAAQRRSRSAPNWKEAASLRAPGMQDCAR